MQHMFLIDLFLYRTTQKRKWLATKSVKIVLNKDTISQEIIDSKKAYFSQPFFDLIEHY